MDACVTHFQSVRKPKVYELLEHQARCCIRFRPWCSDLRSMTMGEQIPIDLGMTTPLLLEHAHPAWPPCRLRRILFLSQILNTQITYIPAYMSNIPHSIVSYTLYSPGVASLHISLLSANFTKLPISTCLRKVKSVRLSCIYMGVCFWVCLTIWYI